MDTLSNDQSFRIVANQHREGSRKPLDNQTPHRNTQSKYEAIWVALVIGLLGLHQLERGVGEHL